MDGFCLSRIRLAGWAVNVGESFYHSDGQQKNLSQPPLELCVSQCDNPILIQDKTHSETKMELRFIVFWQYIEKGCKILPDLLTTQCA